MSSLPSLVNFRTATSSQQQIQNCIATENRQTTLDTIKTIETDFWKTIPVEKFQVEAPIFMNELRKIRHAVLGHRGNEEAAFSELDKEMGKIHKFSFVVTPEIYKTSLGTTIASLVLNVLVCMASAYYSHSIVVSIVMLGFAIYQLIKLLSGIISWINYRHMDPAKLDQYLTQKKNVENDETFAKALEETLHLFYSATYLFSDYEIESIKQDFQGPQILPEEKKEEKSA